MLGYFLKNFVALLLSIAFYIVLWVYSKESSGISNLHIYFILIIFSTILIIFIIYNAKFLIPESLLLIKLVFIILFATFTIFNLFLFINIIS